MNSEETLKRLLGPKSWLFVATAIFAAVCVALIVTALCVAPSDPTEAMKFSSMQSDSDEYKYVDVLLVTDWIYNDEGNYYYAAMDSEGNVFTLKLSKSQFSDLAAQYEANLADDASLPDTKRLYGLSKKLGSSAAGAVGDVLGLAGADEYYEWIGRSYFDATDSPAGNSKDMYFVFALFAGLIALMIGAIYGSKQMTFKRLTRRLEERGLLDAAAQELERGEGLSLGKGALLLTDRFIFHKPLGFALAYDDVAWAHTSAAQYLYFIPISRMLSVNTLDKKHYTLSIPAWTTGSEREQLDEALFKIAEKNPHALIGFSKENKAEYAARVEEARRRGL